MISQFYSTFSKRNNSTKIPDEDTISTPLDLTFKGGVNMDNPTILLDLPDTNGIVPEYTYMRLRVNGTWRYYFVNNPTCITDNVWQFECVLDVLGTYKSEILDNICYVQYSASHGSTLITDTRALQLPYTSTYSVSFPEISDMFTTNYKFVLQCIGNNGDRDVAYASTFFLNSSQSSRLKSVLTSQEFYEWIIQWFTTPIASVVGGAVSAFNMDETLLSEINIGGYATGVNGRPVSSTQIFKKTSSVVPKNALHLYGDYRDMSPYTSYSLQLPFVGVIPLNPVDVARTHDLIIECACTPATGDLLYSVYTDSDAMSETPILLGQYGGNCSSQTAVAGTSSNTKGALSAIANTISQELSALGIGTGGSIGGAFTQVNGAISSLVSAGGGIRPYLMKHSITTSENPSARRNVDGLPYGCTVKLSTLSGFCQCANASVDVPCSSAERERINTLLNGGIYIE